MKKLILGAFIFTAALLFNSNTINAQSFEQGDFNIGGGIGVGSTFGGGLPIGVHAEYGITDAISVGGYGAFASYTSSYWKHTYTIIGARGAYHFGELLSLPDKFDLYGGLGLYNFSSKATLKDSGSILDDYSSSYDGIQFGFHAGARYYFSNRLAVFADLGNQIAYMQIGVTFKI